LPCAAFIGPEKCARENFSEAGHANPLGCRRQ
jgi:hypothetical protein